MPPSTTTRPPVFTASRPAAQPDATTASIGGAETDAVLREIRRILGTIRFGSIALIVQDGRIVQVDTTSKLRLTTSSNGSKSSG